MCLHIRHNVIKTSILSNSYFNSLSVALRDSLHVEVYLWPCWFRATALLLWKPKRWGDATGWITRMPIASIGLDLKVYSMINTDRVPERRHRQLFYPETPSGPLSWSGQNLKRVGTFLPQDKNIQGITIKSRELSQSNLRFTDLEVPDRSLLVVWPELLIFGSPVSPKATEVTYSHQAFQTWPLQRSLCSHKDYKTGLSHVHSVQAKTKLLFLYFQWISQLTRYWTIQSRKISQIYTIPRQKRGWSLSYNSVMFSPSSPWSWRKLRKSFKLATKTS